MWVSTTVGASLFSILDNEMSSPSKLMISTTSRDIDSTALEERKLNNKKQVNYIKQTSVSVLCLFLLQHYQVYLMTLTIYEAPPTR